MRFKKDKLALFWRERENRLIGISPMGHLFALSINSSIDCGSPCYDSGKYLMVCEQCNEELGLYGHARRYPSPQQAYQAMINYNPNVEFLGFI